MTEIIGIDHPDHSSAVIDRVSSLLANKGIVVIAERFPDHWGIRGVGMANRRKATVDLPFSPAITEDEIEYRSISIANEVEAAIRQARDPEALE